MKETCRASQLRTSTNNATRKDETVKAKSDGTAQPEKKSEHPDHRAVVQERDNVIVAGLGARFHILRSRSVAAAKAAPVVTSGEVGPLGVRISGDGVTKFDCDECGHV